MSADERFETAMNSDADTKVTPTEDSPLDVTAALGQLRMIVCGLGAGLLLVSLLVSAFIFKQNRNLNGMTNARRAQITQLQNNQKQILYVINELAKYSAGKPELVAIFAKHGIQITPAAAGNAVPGAATR